MRKYDRTLANVIDDLQVLIEHVQSDICDDYCKYAVQNRAMEEMRSICGNCPLNRLD